MITYDNQSQFLILFQMAGSVIPQSLPIGMFTGGLGTFLAVLRYTGKTEELYKQSYIEKSFAIQVLATVVGYLIVVRTNMALRRWMDGISDIQEMLSKWGDAYNTLIGFFSGKEGPPEMQKRILLFRVRVAHWFSLMSCLAFATLRGGSLGKLSDVPIRELLADEYTGDQFFRDNKRMENGKRLSGSSITNDKNVRKQRTSSFSEKTNSHDSTEAFNPKNSSDLLNHKLEALRESELVVLHRPSNEEVERLESCTDAVNAVCLWIIQGIILEIRAKTLDTPPPIVTRVLQELSNGMLGFSQAHKVAMVPFPFPFAQMVSSLLVFFYIVFPFYVDTFTQNVVVTPLICILVPICYNGLNCLAIELEEPFGCDHNDVDLEVRHEEFNKMLVDTIRQPSKPPRLKAPGETKPEDKISRGVVKGVPEVYRRVDGIWPWELVTSKQLQQEDIIQIRREMSKLDEDPPASSPPNGTPSTKAADGYNPEGTDVSEWAEESHLEEGGNENGYSQKNGLLCGSRCNPGPDAGMNAMRMVNGDLGINEELAQL